jgi:uncharacterized membrane protein YqiK
MNDLFMNYWWVALILIILLLSKYILLFLMGMVIVPENKIGLVTKKFVLFGKNRELPDGRIIATNGEAGFQAKTLAPGIYFGKWFGSTVLQWSLLWLFRKEKSVWFYQKTG